MATQPYTKADIRDAYRRVGVTRGRTVYVTSNMGRLMAFETPGKTAAMEAHLDVIRDLIGAEGTLVVPTASMNICNTDIPFDPATTPSFDIGTFSEFVRMQAGARRSFHPFVSYTALGHDAAAISDNVARHAFGPETPEARMVDADALCLVVGQIPRLTCSTVHHAEMIMGVPYRYTKEYVHPVVRDGGIRDELFYQHVWYRDMDLSRDLNQRIFACFETESTVSETRLGRSRVFSYAVSDFLKLCCRMMCDDIYVWCATPPEKRPYRI